MRTFYKKSICILLMALILLPVISGTVALLTVQASAEESDTADSNYSILTWNPSDSSETYPRGFNDRGTPIISYVGGVFGKDSEDFSVNIAGKSSTSSGIQYNSYDGAPGYLMNSGDTLSLSFDVAFSDADALKGSHQFYFRVRFDGKDLATMNGSTHGYGIDTSENHPRFFPNTLTSSTLVIEQWYNFKALFTLQSDKTTLIAEFYVDDVLLEELVLQKSGGGEIGGFSMIDFTNMTAAASLYVDNITITNYSAKDETTPGAIKGLDQNTTAMINNEEKTFDLASDPYMSAREFLEVTKGAILKDKSEKKVSDHTPLRFLSIYSLNDLDTPYTFKDNSVLTEYPESFYNMNDSASCFEINSGSPVLSYADTIYGKTDGDLAMQYSGAGTQLKYLPNVTFTDTKGFEFSFDIAVSSLPQTSDQLYCMQLKSSSPYNAGNITGNNQMGIVIHKSGALTCFGYGTGVTVESGKWYSIRTSMERKTDTEISFVIEVNGTIVLKSVLPTRDNLAITTFAGAVLFNNPGSDIYIDNVYLRHIHTSELLKSPNCSDDAIAAMLNTSTKTFDFSSNPTITAEEFLSVTENLILLDNNGVAVSDSTPMRFLNLYELEYGIPAAKYAYSNVPAQYEHFYYDMEAGVDAAFPDNNWSMNTGNISEISYPSSVFGRDGKVLSHSGSGNASRVIFPLVQAFGEAGEKFELSFDFAIESQVTGDYRKYIQILYNGIYSGNSLGTADCIHIKSGGKLSIFGKDTGIVINPKQWYSLKFEMTLTEDNTKLAVNAYVDGNTVVSGDFALSTAAAFSKFNGFKIYNDENSPFYFDNVETKHYYKSENRAVFIKELEEITNSIDLIALPDPLNNSSTLTLPSVPSGYRIEIDSSSDESIIDLNGNINRKDTTEKVYITLKITNTVISESRVTEELLVPVYKTYAAPAVTEEQIAAVKAEYEKLKYGVFVHYVPNTVYANGDKWSAIDINGNDIDTLANAFDAEKFAADINEAGAEYVVFTAWHALTYPLFPSMTNERWRDNRWETDGAYAKTYSDRDVIADLITALDVYDIPLHLYVHPSEGKDFADEEQTLTGWNDATNGYSTWNAYTNELMYELGERYGEKLAGLWIDAFFMNIPDEETFKKYATANNPCMIMNMNVGLEDKYHIEASMPEHTGADYRAWEFNHQSSLETIPLTKNQTAIVIGSQWFTDTNKDTDIVINSPEEIFRYIVAQSSISISGGFLASVGCYPNRIGIDDLDNIWQNGIRDTFINVNAYLSALEATVKGTVPGVAYPTEAGKSISELQFVSTESSDGKYVYIHVLGASGNTITLPAPKDGSNFSLSSRIIKSNGGSSFITLTRADDGSYNMTLPEGESFDTVDTVIELKRVDAAPPADEDVKSFVPKFSVSLYSDFICNIYIPVLNNINFILIDGEAIDLTTLDQKEIDGKLFYLYNRSVPSVNAAETIRLTASLKLADGKIATGNFNIGIIEYASIVLTKSPEAHEEALMKDMLSYISAAYTYAKKSNAASVKAKIDALLGEGYSSEPDTSLLDKSPETPALERVSMDIGSVPVFIFYPKTNSNGTLIYDAEKYIFTSNGKELDKVIEIDTDGKTYIKVYTYAYGMCAPIYYSVEGENITGSYNIGAYYEAIRTSDEYKDNTDLISLIERLWNYSESSANYRFAIISK